MTNLSVTLILRWTLQLLFLLLLISAQRRSGKLKLCVVEHRRSGRSHTSKYCNLLGISKGAPVACFLEQDRVGCLRAVSRREADFAVFAPEDLYLSTLWPESSILIVGEMRAQEKLSFEYGAVVIVRNSINITDLKDLRGTNLCHPGMAGGSRRNALFAQYMEDRILPSACDPQLTVYEDRIKTTSELFHRACKAGPWVADVAEDGRLKHKYQNLCALCDDPDRCSRADKYWGSAGSLTCFKDGLGDVLWATYDQVQVHLKPSAGETNEDVQDFRFLCDDGRLMPLATKEPCFWFARPWKVVGANRKSAVEVQKILDHLKDDELNEWESNLLHVVESYMEYIENLMVAKVPEDYLRSFPGYLSANTLSQRNCRPGRSIRWCTSSAKEQEKCVWIAKSAISLAIQPLIECVEKSNVQTCLASVGSGDTDVVVVHPDSAAEAILKHGLVVLLSEAARNFNESFLLFGVVSSNSDIHSLDELRFKKVCFSKSNGFGWNAVLAALQQEGFIRSRCSGLEGLREFFGEVCVMEEGAHGEVETCCKDQTTIDDGGGDALRCLLRGGCDVAFLTLPKTGVNLDSKKVRVVCSGHDPQKCYWSWSYASYIMINSQAQNIKRLEVYNVMSQLGELFGRGPKDEEAMLSIFGPFNNHTHVFFQDSSVHFVRPEHWTQTRDYIAVVQQMKFCSASSTAAPGHFLLMVLVTSATLMVT